MIKRSITVLAVALLFAAALASPRVLAADYSDDQLAHVRNNCGSIKASLQRLQIADSNQRAYLGNVFETAINGFFTPLNVRLVKNGIASPELVNSQSIFTSAKTTFTADYITYAKSLDTLLKVDCASDPRAFLDQLAQARRDRQAISASTSKLIDQLGQHRSQVKSLQETR
jgi:hypothetical protein